MAVIYALPLCPYLLAYSKWIGRFWLCYIPSNKVNSFAWFGGISKYNLSEQEPNIYVRVDEYKYICVISQEKQAAINLIQQVIQQI
jgi:hypothetical protein